MVDLWWTDAKKSKEFRCAKCPESKKQKMRCGEPGLDNIPPHIAKKLARTGKGPGYHRVDDYGLAYTFCPGKATWYADFAPLFEQCRIAMETSLLPEPGGIEDQSELFAAVFPAFVERWVSRRYYRTWADVYEFTPKVLEAVAKMFGGK